MRMALESQHVKGIAPRAEFALENSGQPRKAWPISRKPCVLSRLWHHLDV